MLCPLPWHLRTFTKTRGGSSPRDSSCPIPTRPLRCPGSRYLGVVATHAPRGTLGGGEVVVLVLAVPVLHGQLQVQLLHHDKEVLTSPATVFVVVPDALLCVGLSKGAKVWVPALEQAQSHHQDVGRQE